MALDVLLRNGLPTRAQEATEAFRRRRDAAYTREQEDAQQREKVVQHDLQQDNAQLLAAVLDYVVGKAMADMK